MKIESIGKLYVNFEKPRTVREFLKKFFNYKNAYVVSGIITYYDIECTKIHCVNGKIRSIEDVYSLVNTYYPNVSLIKLIYYLITLDIKNNGQNYYPYLMSCDTIDRINICYANIVNGTMCMSKFSSKYSWKELLEPFDIKRPNDLKKFTDNHRK